MIVVLDSCVLFPAPLRDFLMHLTLLDVFQARWTQEIHKEWLKSVLKRRPDLSEKQLQRTRELMNLHVRDCLVENYRGLINKLTLPDPNDRHVLAAAIKCKAEAIVTFNLRDFPINVLAEHGLIAVTPDDLIGKRFEEFSEKIKLAFDRQLASLKKPPKTRDELMEILNQQGLKKTVKELSETFN
ncbi:MAG: PIN domain-containing protein [Pyrinomonadaceae bacterium]